ncbi:MAG: EAL domain-containing protein [Caulobacterales bacterium]
MPLITHALLYVGYALIALTTGLAMSKIGGADAASSFLSGMALFCAAAITHGGISASFGAAAVGRTEKRLRGDIDKMRQAHREVLADIDAVTARLDSIDQSVLELSDRIVSTPQIPARAPAPEMHMLDQLVDRLGRAIESRFDDVKRLASPGAPRGAIDIVRDALYENRIELHLQPIVSLPQRKTAFYEGFTRLKDSSGRLILPQEFIPAAEQSGMMGLIDNLLMFRCVQIVRKLAKNDRRVGIFCNLAPRALADEAFFPQFLDFMREHIDLAGSVIFELPQDAFETRSSFEARAMSKLVDLGFRFSIDKVTHIEVDLPDLERAGVRYFKAPAHLLADQLIRQGARPKSAITREITSSDVCAVFQRYGIDVIAERVEHEPQVPEILDLDVPYGQGHLFGPPRAIKESLMEETAPPRDFMERRGRVA